MKLLNVTFHHDGVFIPNPLKYVLGLTMIINDTWFEEMPVSELFEFVDRLVASPTKRLYYVVPGTTLTRGIREITSDDDMAEFVKVGFENSFKVDLYHEYNDYDVMAYTTNDNLFPNEGDNLGDDETVVEQEKYPDPKFKAQTDVQYPSYNPDLPWKEFVPVLGMKFDNPQQLKHALADYGVANGYQLWYYRSDGNSLLVYCGRDVEMGRCAGRRVIRKKKKEQQKQKANGKGVMPANQSVQPVPKIKWTRMRVQEHKGKSCPFRLWATWMSSEKSFQIKSLYADHRCTRNYNLGSLVTFKWIARHYVNEIVMNPSLTYRFMREDIREKFMIDVSIGQCKRAKQCALYEHGEGLIEHYGRLWEYRQAVLESNPGSTCHLDVDFNNDGQPVFQRMYVCFKGVKDGWIAGCRKVIGIDGCFITHMCKGEILTAMGRDGNNQMYPIAWAVVDVENKNNWCWFLSLLADDLDLQEGLGVTIISDSHKGLIEAVRTWLPQAEHRHCTRHIYVNFKRKWSGLIYKRLFWGAAASTIEQDFTRYMEQIRQLDPEAYRYLMEREPERWSKAYFQTGRSCASFENGISESFNAQIIDARGLAESSHARIVKRLAITKLVVKILYSSQTATMKNSKWPPIFVVVSRKGEVGVQRVGASKMHLCSKSGVSKGWGLQMVQGGANGGASKSVVYKGCKVCKEWELLVCCKKCIAKRGAASIAKEAARQVMQEEMEEEERRRLIAEEEQREYQYNLEMLHWSTNLSQGNNYAAETEECHATPLKSKSKRKKI
ncbi:hypothetical protein Tco_0997855 [Tanacetum coccineum]